MTTSSLWRGVGDVAAASNALLSAKQAAALGLSSNARTRLVRRAALERPAPGVFRLRGAPATWHQRLLLVTLTGGGRGSISHRAAAALHGIDEFTHELVKVTVPRGAKILVDDVIVHQSALVDADVIALFGIRCTTLARTILDVASVVDARLLERAMDHFQRTGHSLARLDREIDRLHRPGQRGTKAVHLAVERRRLGGAVRGSWFEKLIEECIASPRLPTPVLQHEIWASDGSFIARVDLAFPALRIAIEAHSRSFHSGTHSEVVDQRRENRALAEGWLFVYLGWADRRTPAQARGFLERLVTRRAKDLGLTTK